MLLEFIATVDQLYCCRSSQKILSSMGNMRDWVSRAQLDPNDPSNAELFQYIKVTLPVKTFNIFISIMNISLSTLFSKKHFQFLNVCYSAL